jgi:integrase
MPITLRHRESKKGLVYYLDITQNGKRYKETLNIPFSLNKQDRIRLATQVRNDRENDLLNSLYGRNPVTKTRNFLTYFSEHINGHPQRDVRKYHNTLRHLKLCFGSTFLTNQVNDQSMTTWKQYLERNFKGETPRTMWNATRAIINQAKRDGIYQREPAPNIKRPKYEARIAKEVLFVNELIRLANTPYPNKDVCVPFLFCCYTGLGHPETKSLNWTQISLEDRTMRYTRHKTQKEVVVDLAQSAIQLLGERSNGKVFPFLPSDSYCGRVIRLWCDAAGISKRLSWYCARHTFAVILLSSGTDLVTVSRLMGHASIKQTQVYLNYVDPLKREAVDRLPKI